MNICRERAPAFVHGEQHDAVEALEALLEAVCEELQKAYRHQCSASHSLAELLHDNLLEQTSQR